MGLPKAFSISAGHYHNLVLVRGIDAEIYHRQFLDAATRLASDEESRHRLWALPFSRPLLELCRGRGLLCMSLETVGYI